MPRRSIKNFENITGSAHADTLTGDGLANVIDGGAGADAMNGGAGNDTYVVDNLLDVITEALTGGTDLVKSSIDYSLLNTNLENLTLTGIARHRCHGQCPCQYPHRQCWQQPA